MLHPRMRRARFARTGRALAAILVAYALVSPVSTGAQGVAASTPAAKVEPGWPLQRGQESLDAVAATVVAALGANDKQAMLAALVSTEEYRDYVIPSSVEPGQAWRVWKDKARQFFADEYRAKNEIVVERLLQTYGGKPLQLDGWRMTTEPKRYAGYVAHGELRITVRLDPPQQLEAPKVLRLGYVAEVGGKFKLLGFIADTD